MQRTPPAVDIPSVKWIRRWAMVERLFWQQLVAIWDRGGHDPGDLMPQGPFGVVERRSKYAR